MKFLTPSQILKQASGARRLTDDETKEGLFDTQAFIQLVDKLYGMKPVMAVQGTPHKDSRAGELSQSKHLIGVAKPGGAAIFLLNSHTPRRRTWIASGFVRRLEREGDIFALIGAAVPVQRWRGIGQALDEVARHHHEVTRARQVLKERIATPADVDYMIEQTLANAYMPGHKTAARDSMKKPAALHGLFDVAFKLLATLQEPGLKIEGTGRRMKPLTGPDALFYAGNAIFDIAMRRLDRYGERIGMSLPMFYRR